MVEAGLATHLVSSQKLEQLEEKLGEAGAKAADSSIVERILSSFQVGYSEYKGIVCHSKTSLISKRAQGFSDRSCEDSSFSVSDCKREAICNLAGRVP